MYKRRKQKMTYKELQTFLKGQTPDTISKLYHALYSDHMIDDILKWYPINLQRVIYKTLGLDFIIKGDPRDEL